MAEDYAGSVLHLLLVYAYRGDAANHDDEWLCHTQYGDGLDHWISAFRASRDLDYKLS